VANHFFDDVLGADASVARALANTMPLAVQALLLAWAWWAARPKAAAPTP
jgi:hypothetical protein